MQYLSNKQLITALKIIKRTGVQDVSKYLLPGRTMQPLKINPYGITMHTQTRKNEQPRAHKMGT